MPVLAAVLASVLASVAFTVHDPRIDEASGLVDLGRLSVVTNDSGDTGRVFVLDDNGRTVGTTTYGDQTDVEALAPSGAHHVWVGDIGDNGRRRSTVAVRRVPVGVGERTVAAPAYRLAYPDGSHDAETLLCDPRTGRLYVVTKEVFGGTLYAAPDRLSAGVVNPMTKVADGLPALATDGAFLPDGTGVVVRGYVSAAIYRTADWRRTLDVQLPSQQQGESVSLGPHGRLRVGSEGVDQPVHDVALPLAELGLRAATAAGPGSR